MSLYYCEIEGCTNWGNRRKYKDGYHTFCADHRFQRDQAQRAAYEKKRRKMLGVGQKKWQELRAQVLERDNYTCQECGKVYRHGRWPITVDHIIPLCRGGETTLENLQALCAKCNGKKAYSVPGKGKLVDRWYELL